MSVDAVAQTATVDSGVQLRPFLDQIARYDLAFPTSPYWSGVSMAGVIGTGAHGSTLVGKVLQEAQVKKEIYVNMLLII